MARRIQ